MKYVLMALMVLQFGLTRAEAKEQVTVIKEGSRVAFDYTLSADGKVIESSIGKKPLEYTQGDGTIIPGLTKRLLGLHAGSEKTVVVPPEEAYGKFDPAGIKEFPMSQMPPNVKPQPGMMLQASDLNGRSIPVRVVKVNKDSVLMDINHPLAGKTLTFKVKIVSVK